MKRNEVPKEITWKLEDLYPSEEDFEEDILRVSAQAEKLEGRDLVAMSLEELADFLKSYEDFLIRQRKIDSFSYLSLSVDRTQDFLQKRQARVSDLNTKLSNKLSYITTDLQKIPVERLEELKDSYPQYELLVKNLLRDRPHLLSEETEKTLIALDDAFSLPYESYNMIKLADMRFEDFQVQGKSYPMSYVLFENDYSHSPDTSFRRAAYENFYSTIGRYSFGMAAGYLSHVKTEKAMSQLRGFESVTDYLLLGQDVSREVYELHLETMMEHLSPVMQKYAGFLKDYYGLDKLHYSDLKAPVDSAYSPSTTLEQAKEDARRALEPLGEDYSKIVREALDGRWIDFAQNEGKSTGGFCATPYGSHSYILMSWTGNLSDTYTLVHELGHAGHFQLAGENQNFFSVRPSTYLVEAPSTCNELFLTDYLFEKEDSLRNKRYVVASFLGNTYYHNFVTHFLEAYFQKRVYDALDQGQSLSASDLHRMKKEVLQEFWKDSVEIDDRAGYTWMRQPHYYMGLYPYTYSAGLSIATNAFLKLKDKSLTTSDWIELLKLGGRKNPQDFALQIGLDLKDNKSLLKTIGYVETLVDELIELSSKLDN